MARVIPFILLTLFATLTLAAPAPHHSLQKRSFSAHARGRRHLTPYQEVLRTHRKYDWEIIVVDQDPDNGFAVPSYSARASQASVSTAAVGPQVLTQTVFVTASAPAPTETGVFSEVAESATFNSTKTMSSPTSTAGNEDGEVTTVPEENESEYITPVTVGGQKVNLNFDTGSADLWVFSSLLSSSELGGHSYYDPTKSKTFESYDGGSWQIQYGDGSGASGTVGYDIVDVGGTTVQKQCVELADTISRQFISDEASDGLLGLAFSSISTVQPTPQKTFFENVMPQLTLPVFTADLEETDGTGTYEFGQIDSSKYHGEIHYTPIDNSDGFWQFNAASYSVGGKESPCNNCSPAIADTGTSLIYMDKSVVNTYYAAVDSAYNDRSQGGWTFPCNAGPLPDFGVSIGEGADAYMAIVNGTNMAYAPLDDGTGMCFGGLQEGPGNVQILGDVFLKQFFAVFDGGEKKFGVALKS